jgi:hypothetical protein
LGCHLAGVGGNGDGALHVDCGIQVMGEGDDALPMDDDSSALAHDNAVIRDISDTRDSAIGAMTVKMASLALEVA